MEETMSPVERLDVVAKVKARSINAWRWALLILPLALPILDRAQPVLPNGMPARLLVLAAILTVGVLAVAWRYSVCALAAWELFLCVCDVAAVYRSFPQLSVFDTLFFPCALLVIAYGTAKALTVALPFARINGPEWKNERMIVKDFQKRIHGAQIPGSIEFETGSLWRGHWRFCIMNTEHYWVIGKCHHARRWFQVDAIRELNQVTFSRLKSGNWRIEILGKEKLVQEVKLIGPLPQAFTPFISPAV